MNALQTIRIHAVIAIATVLLLASARIAGAAPTTSYVKTEGLDIYYELHGKLAADRTPLLLVHGAFCTIEICFGNVIPELAKTRPVIAIELQGHGCRYFPTLATEAGFVLFHTQWGAYA